MARATRSMIVRRRSCIRGIGRLLGPAALQRHDGGGRRRHLLLVGLRLLLFAIAALLPLAQSLSPEMADSTLRPRGRAAPLPYGAPSRGRSVLTAISGERLWPRVSSA